MVSEVDAFEHVAGEPVLDPLEDRRAVRTWPPFAACELVDLIACLAPEQHSQLLLVFGNEMHDQNVGTHRHAIGPVLHRQTCQEPWRMDRHLRGEPHQAPSAVAVGRGGNDEQRIVQLRHESRELGARPFAHCSTSVPPQRRSQRACSR